jgi:hypothetical protein
MTLLLLPILAVLVAVGASFSLYVINGDTCITRAKRPERSVEHAWDRARAVLGVDGIRRSRRCVGYSSLWRPLIGRR